MNVYVAIGIDCNNPEKSNVVAVKKTMEEAINAIDVATYNSYGVETIEQQLDEEGIFSFIDLEEDERIFGFIIRKTELE